MKYVLIVVLCLIVGAALGIWALLRFARGLFNR